MTVEELQALLALCPPKMLVAHLEMGDNGIIPYIIRPRAQIVDTANYVDPFKRFEGEEKIFLIQ